MGIVMEIGEEKDRRVWKQVSTQRIGQEGVMEGLISDYETEEG